MLEGMGEDIVMQKKGKKNVLFCLYIVDLDTITELFG